MHSAVNGVKEKPPSANIVVVGIIEGGATAKAALGNKNMEVYTKLRMFAMEDIKRETLYIGVFSCLTASPNWLSM